MTYEQFINREKYLWGEDYVDDLFDRGYSVVLTTKGFKWIMPLRSSNISASLSASGNHTSR